MLPSFGNPAVVLFRETDSGTLVEKREIKFAVSLRQLTHDEMPGITIGSKALPAEIATASISALRRALANARPPPRGGMRDGAYYYYFSRGTAGRATLRARIPRQGDSSDWLGPSSVSLRARRKTPTCGWRSRTPQEPTTVPRGAGDGEPPGRFMSNWGMGPARHFVRGASAVSVCQPSCGGPGIDLRSRGFEINHVPRDAGHPVHDGRRGDQRVPF